jgi:hypothetical protein
VVAEQSPGGTSDEQDGEEGILVGVMSPPPPMEFTSNFAEFGVFSWGRFGGRRRLKGKGKEGACQGTIFDSGYYNKTGICILPIDFVANL